MTKIKKIQIPIPYPVKWVNCYYIRGSVPTLIDVGVNSDECLRTIKSAIEAEGGKLSDVRRIIATHGHADHIGLAGRIQEISGAEVFVNSLDSARWAHRGSEESLQRREDFRKFLMEAGIPKESVDELVGSIISRFMKMYHPVSTENGLEDGKIFKFDDFDLQVIHTPGHSPGSICLLNKADGALFSGDTLMPELVTNPTTEKTGASEYRSLIGHQASLELIKSLGVKRVLPGHGAPFENLEVRIQKIQGQHDKRSRQILRILAEGNGSPGKHEGMTQFMVATELFGSLSGRDLFFGVSSARAYLDALEDQGRATRHNEGSRHVYRLNES